MAFGVFLLILLFAGWFLDANSNDPAPLYLSFVLTATTYLVLLIALFLSAFSLPADIKNHTIYTMSRSLCGRAKSCWAASWVFPSSAR